ncbi:MAG: flagellar type III secretion system pore protein FliP [Planctomycetaceae bacterium]
MDDYSTISKLMQDGTFQDLSPQLRTAIFIGGMAFLSSMLVTMTAFTRIVIVLSFTRRALSTQEIPPTQVIIGLAMFLTFFVMGPTVQNIESNALRPYLEEEINGVDAWMRSADELRLFMLRQTRTQDLQLFLEMAQAEKPSAAEDTPMRVLIPAFVISELKTAFIMGFCLYLPFVLVDLVVSVILMALGMMMMPPVIISTPCKILLFILVDGWSLIAKALSMSFN